MKPFTKEAGILIQQNQIKTWGFVLTEKVMTALRREAETRNRLLPDNADGYQVWRGTDMDGYIQNMALSLKRIEEQNN